MNLLLIGYGKMGKAIEEIALKKGHNIVDKIDSGSDSIGESISNHTIDLAIEFSQPDAAFRIANECIENKLKIISGTTGWLDKLPEIKTLCEKKSGTFFHASNYSLGMNIFFKINQKLAELMAGRLEFETEVNEIHHSEKKDSPSGTAIVLAEKIISANPQLKEWVSLPKNSSDQLEIKSSREGSVPGTHIVAYNSPLESIQIKHETHDRFVFAEGALLVAEWIENHQGFLTMDDFLKK